MPTYKRIDGDYNITTLNPDDDVVVTTNTVKVFGNLDVAGNLTYINVQELNIQDPFILLNASNTGSYASNSGVLTHVTASNFAGIRYNDTAGYWELSVNTGSSGITGSWTQIATGAGGGVAGSNTEIQFNNAGSFGANASLTFDYAASKLVLDGHLVLGNIGSAPVATANAAALYNNVVGSGGTGVYVKSVAVDDELVSKTKAIVFGIIF